MLSLKRSKLEKLVFILLVFLAPTQLAFHWWPNFAHIFGIRVDYLAPSLYLTDILVLMLLILQKQAFFLSINKKLFLIILFAFVNVYFAIGPIIAAFKWLKVFEFIFLAYFIAKNKEFKLEGWLLKPLCLSITFFSLVALMQFILGRTLGGVFYFLGERNFSISTPGIALTNFNGNQFLRPYSTFPHPNSMAGYLLVAAILVFYFKKKDIFRNFALVFSAIAITLSSSLGAFLSFVFIPLSNFLLKKRVSIILIGLIVLSFLGPILSGSLLSSGNYPQTIKERLVLAETAGKIFSLNPITGVGLNNFFVAGKSLQPVHNIFLLVLSETGIVGLILFLFLIMTAIRNQKLAVPILVILLTGLVDHYWLTLQQNELLLSIVFGVSLRRIKHE